MAFVFFYRYFFLILLQFCQLGKFQLNPHSVFIRYRSLNRFVREHIVSPWHLFLSDRSEILTRTINSQIYIKIFNRFSNYYRINLDRTCPDKSPPLSKLHKITKNLGFQSNKNFLRQTSGSSFYKFVKIGFGKESMLIYSGNTCKQ